MEREQYIPDTIVSQEKKESIKGFDETYQLPEGGTLQFQEATHEYFEAYKKGDPLVTIKLDGGQYYSASFKNTERGFVLKHITQGVDGKGGKETNMLAQGVEKNQLAQTAKAKIKEVLQSIKDKLPDSVKNLSEFN